MKENTNKVTRQKFYGCAKFSKGGCGETASVEGTSAEAMDHDRQNAEEEGVIRDLIPDTY